MLERAWIVGADGVVSWYEELADKDTPYYSVWLGKQLRFTYDGDDIEEGAELLKKNLEMVSRQRNSSLLTIKLHKEKNRYVNDKTPYNAAIEFRCVPIEEDEVAYASLPKGIIGQLQQQIKDLKEEKNAAPKGIMGYLEPMLENPEVQAMLAGMAAGVFQKVMGIFAPGGQPGALPTSHPQPAAAMAGVQDPNETEAEKLDEALLNLEKADPEIIDDLARLAKLATDKPDVFKLLVTQLRSM